ncbi:MAG: hypothetical protein FWH50_00390 [Coriobacteriia bacterium]|nr:hypothetical protein [Coriobacteriia bacterium]
MRKPAWITASRAALAALTLAAMLLAACSTSQAFDDQGPNYMIVLPATPAYPTAESQGQASYEMLPNINLIPGCEPYAPILEALLELQVSGFSDLVMDQIDDSIMVFNLIYNSNTRLRYAFVDLDKDGSPELLIGVGDADSSYVELHAIYALRDGQPRFVYQNESRSHFRVQVDSNGGYVLELSNGRMGYAQETFFRLGEDGWLFTVDKLLTKGEIVEDSHIVGYRRFRVVGDAELSITEAEYCSLIQEYGAYGYYPLEHVEGTRTLEPSWEYLALLHAI